LVLLACGFYSHVIGFLPALTMSNEVAEEGVAKLSDLFHTVIK